MLLFFLIGIFQLVLKSAYISLSKINIVLKKYIPKDFFISWEEIFKYKWR